MAFIAIGLWYRWKQMQDLIKINLTYFNPNPLFTRTVVLPIFVMSDRFCQAVRLIFEIGIFLSIRPILCNSCPILSQRFQMKLSKNLWTKNFPLFFLVHRFIENFIWNIWLMIGQELHKIGWRDRKIPISKIGRTAWQNRTDSKNLTDFGFSCKWGVNKLLNVTQAKLNQIKLSFVNSLISLLVTYLLWKICKIIIFRNKMYLFRTTFYSFSLYILFTHPLLVSKAIL